MSQPLSSYTVVLASAGTGKTFQLSNRFISVIARDPSLDPAKVLATTFTRKAAGEILDRVLQRLAEAASNDAKALELDRFIGLSLGRAGYVALCGRIASSLHRLGIQTIDAFTARVVGALGLDLGLPPGWRIAEEDEDQRLRIEAVDLALREADRDEIFALISLWHAGGFGRSAHVTLLDIIGRLYEAFLLARARREPWHTINPERPPLSTSQLDALLESLRQADCSSANNSKPNSKISTAVLKLVGAAQSAEWEHILGTTLAQSVRSGDNTYSRSQLQPSLVTLIARLSQHATSAAISQLAAQNSAAYSLISRFDAAYQRLKSRRGLYRFDDLPRHILSRPFDELLTRLYFRLDAQVQHLLFDEFQDTSVLQFKLLEPMCDEVLSQDDGTRSFLCVGDTKQSLYGWRGAKSQLLANIPNRWPTVSTHELAVSYRSSQTVLDAVNSVFENLPSNSNLAQSDAGRDVAAAWAASYTTHRAAHQHLKGHVRLWSVAPADNAPGDPAITATVQRVAEIRAQAPAASIGILVRSNKTIPVIIHELLLSGIPASEEGASLLTDSAAVATVASLFHLADHPDDTASLFHLATSPFAPLFNLSPDRLTTKRDQLRTGLGVARNIRDDLAVRGYQHACEHLVRQIASAVDDRGLRRLEQMIDLAVAFDRRRTPRPSEFAKLLRTKPVADPVAMNVRVMTIHKSKGLEFDAVILPELAKPRNGTPSVLVDHINEQGERSPFADVSHASLAKPQAVCDFHPQLFAMHQNTAAAQLSEDLCVLYVAMTRAIHSLDMIVASIKNESESVSAAGILCAAFHSSNVQSGDQLLHESGASGWYTPSTKHKPTREVQRRAISLRKAERPPSSRWPRRSPSSLEGGPSRSLDSVLKIEPTHGLERGTLIHAFCESIEWLDAHAAPSESSLIATALSLGWSETSARQEAALFLSTLKGPLARTFSRARYADQGEASVRREWAFAAPALNRDEHVMLSGQIDRLVLIKQAGRVVAAEVLDFKTDAVTPGDPAFMARVDHYRPQLSAYRAAVARVFSLPREAVRATLVFLTAEAEVELEP